MKFIKSFFGGGGVSELKEIVEKVSGLEPEIKKLSNEEIKNESLLLRKKLKASATLDEILPKAFALVRETALRNLKQRPFDVQLMGGIVIHRGTVAEMTTGEGKTLSAVAPVYLNALSEKGVHVVTVNEYLARRDAVWMGQIYQSLGLSVACLVPNGAYLYDPDFKIPEAKEGEVDKERDTTGSFLVQQDFLRPVSRREAYLAHVTYGTNHEFGFDYLRDNLAYNLESQTQRGHHFAVIDEVDSILIDEARTPLIIAAPDEESSDFYKKFAKIVAFLEPEKDFEIEEKHRSVSLTEAGNEKIEKMIGISNLYAPEHIRLVHYLEESLKAFALFKRDKDYVVKNGEIFIVDEFTGRVLFGRRYSGGLHQAIEAKEGVVVREESRTYAKISIQNYFRLYQKISGMTGTAQTSAEEFHKVYNLNVVSIPTNKPLVRKDHQDVIYKTQKAKWEAVVNEVRLRHEKGQPVLLGTASIQKNELISSLLSQAGIPHEALNAKNNEREGAIIAQAGRMEGVTVATNMAGRGVDIILGGNPPDPIGATKVRELGGLHVIGTERHEARRIDNQLRGRAGRQGDPGSSQFFLALDDDLIRIFGGDRIAGVMEKFNISEDVPIELGMISSAVAQAQSRVEGANFDLRKHLLEYDDILNKQRTNVYKKRQEFLESAQKGNLANLIYEVTERHLEKLKLHEPVSEVDSPEVSSVERIAKFLEEAGIANSETLQAVGDDDEKIKALLVKKSNEIAHDPMTLNRMLGILDMLWMTHLENLEALSDSVGLRAYGQKDPLLEYREESRQVFRDFWDNFNAWIFSNIFKLANQTNVINHPRVSPNKPAADHKVGRNDPCPCGSGKKYKKCHGK